MKKTLSIFFAALFFSAFYSACKKKDKAPVETEIPAPVAPAPTQTTTPPPPPPDPYAYSSDLQSSKDMVFAMNTLSDVEMLCAFIGENQMFPAFYGPAGPNAGSWAITRDTLSRYMLVAYNNALCKDGKTRDGTVAFDYSASNANAKYYRNYDFFCRVMFMNYEVDGWKINTDSAGAYIRNNLSSANFNPSTTNLTWKFSGSVSLVKKTDPDRKITWNGAMTKVLANTSDPAVYSTARTQVIDWTKARVQYSGLIQGTINGLNYKYQPDSVKIPLRDFACSVPLSSPQGSSIHPFTAGMALFTISNYHPRNIDFGPPQVCDNKGAVSFKGETYNVDFD
jgi:hypothetical protein